MNLTMILLGVAVVAIVVLAGTWLASSRGRASHETRPSAVPLPPPREIVPDAAISGERTYAPREEWESISLEQLQSAELVEGASRTTGPVDAFRVPARLGEYEERVELLWFTTTGRAAVAFAGRSFWTNARSPEAALRAWAGDRASGVRTAPR